WEIDLALRFHDAPTIVFTIAGTFGLLAELFYPAVLVSPRLRRFLPPAVIMVHAGVWLGQDVLFVDAFLLPLVFMVPSRWRRPPDDGAASAAEPPRPWRGPRIPIALVVAVLFLDYTTGHQALPWRWPVVTWQMYRHKGPTD